MVEPQQERAKESREQFVGSARAAQPRGVSFFEQLFGGGGTVRPSPPRRVTR